MSPAFETLIKAAFEHAFKVDKISVAQCASDTIAATTGILYGCYGVKNARDALMKMVEDSVTAANRAEMRRKARRGK